MEELKPDLIIHTAAQPSHDRAAAIPFLDFEVNALGTLHLLEGGAPLLSRVAVHSHVDQQGLWGPAQHAAAGRTRNTLGLRGPGL